MIKLVLDQDSPEWHKLRRSKITATSCAAICGFDSYKTVHDVYDFLVNERPIEPMNEAMKRGKELEPEACRLISLQLGKEFKPTVVLHDKEQWAMASLDGLSVDDSAIIEIKCPGTRKHTEHIEGIISTSYQYQMLWQMICTGLDKCTFCSYNPEHKIPLHMVEFSSKDFDLRSILLRCKDFYLNNVCASVPPWKFKPRD